MGSEPLRVSLFTTLFRNPLLFGFGEGGAIWYILTTKFVFVPHHHTPQASTSRQAFSFMLPSIVFPMLFGNCKCDRNENLIKSPNETSKFGPLYIFKRNKTIYYCRVLLFEIVHYVLSSVYIPSKPTLMSFLSLFTLADKTSIRKVQSLYITQNSTRSKLKHFLYPSAHFSVVRIPLKKIYI